MGHSRYTPRVNRQAIAREGLVRNNDPACTVACTEFSVDPELERVAVSCADLPPVMYGSHSLRAVPVTFAYDGTIGLFVIVFYTSSKINLSLVKMSILHSLLVDFNIFSIRLAVITENLVNA